jgi:hypothetical protein
MSLEFETFRRSVAPGRASWLLLSALVAATSCRSASPEEPAGKPLASTGAAPQVLPASSAVPAAARDVLIMFIKRETCQPSTCSAFSCETFSSGQTQGLPSHVARCKWQDSKAPNPTSVNRCAYTHYSENAARDGFQNMFLAKLASGDGCAPDPEFTKLLKTDLGYTGQLP